jgi:ribosomal protein S8E
MSTQVLTQVEFEGDDFEVAEKIAARLGFEQTAYTSTSALWGLFCLPENPEYAKSGQATKGGCIIKTEELGFLFVQDGEDLHLGNDFSEVRD